MRRYTARKRKQIARFTWIDAAGVALAAGTFIAMALLMATKAQAQSEAVRPAAIMQAPKVIIASAAEETEAAAEPIAWDYNISYGDEPNAYEVIWENATEEEKELTALILALEAQAEPYEGQKAVVEVIMNRVLSDEWPDTIKGVLSQKGQFATWRYRTHPYNTPTEEQYRAVEEAIKNGPSVIPDDYVFFATSRVNGKGHIRIGHHWFSRGRR